jgi:hypothetical protein
MFAEGIAAVAAGARPVVASTPLEKEVGDGGMNVTKWLESAALSDAGF